MRHDAFAAFSRVGFLLVMLGACAGAQTLFAQASLSDVQAPVLLDNMDTSAPTLKLLNAAAEIRVVGQSIERGVGQFGSASERVLLVAPAGSSAFLAYNIPPAAVIEELRLAAWISCNRPGAQLAATVVLPRSVDPRTGRPQELLVRAGAVAPAAAWQQVTLEQLPSHLADQARVARASHGGEIDERGAYVSQLVILAPGGPGVTELVVDQITVHGVLARPGQIAESAAPAATISQVAAEMPAKVNSFAAKRPAAPRIIQWQGEPPEMLQRMGFDAVWMGRLPTERELAETSRLGMFIVCPPPNPAQLKAEGLGQNYAPVLAWDLGQLTRSDDIDHVHRFAQAIEMYETDAARPVLLEPFGLAREASRIADVVLLGSPMLGSTQTWSGYATGLSQQRQMTRPGTPVWVNIETHCGTRFMAQLSVLRGGQGSAIVPASFGQVSRATTAAFGAAPGGFCFQSQTSLAGTDVDNRMRALALELTNLRLGLAEPWLAAGRIGTAANSTRPLLTGIVLKVERSHLIVPLRWDEGGVEGPVEDTQQPIAFDLPGVPESCDSYLVSISGSQRLQGRRVAGGLRISVDHLPDDAFVLVTEDGYAFSHVERYLREHAPRAAQARIELAALQRQQAAQAVSQLPEAAVELSGVRRELAQVDTQMTAVVETMRRRDYAGAYALAAEVERLLDVSLHRLATAAAPTLPAGASPLPIDWSTIADIVSVGQALSHHTTPLQVFPGGEFEELDALVHGGWQRVQDPPEGVETSVRLSTEAPARGTYCLDLEASSKTNQNNPPMLPRPPVWVTSPPIQAPAGHVVEITGLARIGEVPIGSPDPLLVFDSVGGEESAVRISSARSWTPFRMVRAAAPGGELRLTIALGGIGRAQVDSLAYRFVPIEGDAVARFSGQPR
jgi:hypothetical protein